MGGGGRQIACLKRTTAVKKSVSSAMRTGDVIGMCFQTSFAKGHRKRVCIDVSTSLQRGQWAAANIPLLCRFAPMGKAPCMIDQRKILSFGLVFADHMSFIQLNSRLGCGLVVAGRGLAITGSARELYPDLVE